MGSVCIAGGASVVQTSLTQHSKVCSSETVCTYSAFACPQKPPCSTK